MSKKVSLYYLIFRFWRKLQMSNITRGHFLTKLLTVNWGLLEESRFEFKRLKNFVNDLISCQLVKRKCQVLWRVFLTTIYESLIMICRNSTSILSAKIKQSDFGTGKRQKISFPKDFERWKLRETRSFTRKAIIMLKCALFSWSRKFLSLKI